MASRRACAWQADADQIDSTLMPSFVASLQAVKEAANQKEGILLQRAEVDVQHLLKEVQALVHKMLKPPLPDIGAQRRADAAARIPLHAA